MTVPHHEEWYTIYGFQTDETGKASLQSVCGYMEDAAGNHAAKLGLSMDRLEREGVAWILSRMCIAPESMPAMNERICVETWPVGLEGLQYRRDFIVRREDGGIVAKAVSHWVVVTLATRRVGRVPQFIAETALANAGVPMPGGLGGKSRLPLVEDTHEACRFRARRADIDRNGHVNNIRYMDWVLESVPPQSDGVRQLRGLELSFKAESFYNEIISARTMPGSCGAEHSEPGGETQGGVGFFHSLTRVSDGRELVRAATLWE